MIKITEIETIPLTIPTKKPFKISTGVYPSVDKVIVKVHTNEGIIGFGEAVPLHTYSEETQESIVAALERYISPAVNALDPSNFALLNQAMDRALYGNPFAKAAMDMAAYDIAGKSLALPAYQLLGGAYRDRIPLAMSIGIMSREATIDRAQQIISEGYKVVKLKVADTSTMDYVQDLRAVEAVREAVGPEQLVRIDANGGYPTAQTAIREIRRMDEYDLYLVEQPLTKSDILGMVEVTRAVRPPTMVDEGVYTPLDAMNIIRLRAADVINIKTQQAGGLFNAYKIAAVCEAAGVPTQIGSQMETGVGTAANAHLAAAIKHQLHAADIKTPEQFLDDILRERLLIQNGYTHVPQGPGLGVQVDEEKLMKYRSRR